MKNIIGEEVLSKIPIRSNFTYVAND